MIWIAWGGILPVCLAGAWLIYRRPVRRAVEEFHFDQARDLFRLRREWLEAHFLAALSKEDPLERVRWEDAHWQDEVLWARERPSRRLIALIGVEFDPDPLFDLPDNPPRQATALFEFRKGRWHAEGKRLDEISPDEAFLSHHRRLEPVVTHQRRT